MLKKMITLTLISTLAFADAPVLKTGQTTVYKAGDDGTYQSGLERSYSRANGVVTDNATGLQWQDDYSDNAGEIKQATWEDAKTYCENLMLDTKTDWRLPTQKELRTLVDNNRTYPSIDPIFVNVTSHYYWSSTTYAGDTSGAWFVSFDGGDDYAYNKGYSIYVRCVRSGQ